MRLKDKTVKELRIYAKNLNIKNPYKLDKKNLIEKIREITKICYDKEHNWRIIKTIKEGKRVKIFQACDKNDCKFILKYLTTPSHKGMNIHDRLKHEVKYQTMFANNGFSLYVYDYWKCGENGAIIMEQADGNFEEFIQSLYKGKKISPTNFKKAILSIKRIAELLMEMHNLGYAHGDLSTKNVVYKKIGKTIRWYIIDFEYVKKIDEDDYETMLFDIDYFGKELCVELKQTNQVKCLIGEWYSQFANIFSNYV